MANQSEHRIAWRRLTAELFAIVFGILVAFALQASWEARNDRLAERHLLEALQTELSAARNALDAQRWAYEYVDQATALVAKQLSDAGSGSVITIADTLLAGLLLEMSYDPPMGTVSTLLSSGQLELLEDLELRTVIAGWPAAVADGVEEQQRLWDLADNQVKPLLHEAVPDLGPAYRILSVWEARREILNEGISSVSAVTASPPLWNVLHQRVSVIRSGRADFKTSMTLRWRTSERWRPWWPVRSDSCHPGSPSNKELLLSG
jgi:hypothetical protein